MAHVIKTPEMRKALDGCCVSLHGLEIGDAFTILLAIMAAMISDEAGSDDRTATVLMRAVHSDLEEMVAAGRAGGPILGGRVQ